MNLNKVKRRISLLGVLSFVGIGTSFAQHSNTGINTASSGIYLDSADYNKGKLSFEFNGSSTGKIRLNDLFSSAYIDVTVNGKKTRLNKDSIFGYRTCTNETYRFYKKHDEEFRILESKGIVLYLSFIRVSSNNGKTNQIEPAYFFSKTGSSEILPLTILNLKRSFPDNIRLHDMLDVEFGGGESLSAYSATANMYKVNELLYKSTLK